MKILTIDWKQYFELALVQDFVPFVADAAPFFYNQAAENFAPF